MAGGGGAGFVGIGRNGIYIRCRTVYTPLMAQRVLIYLTDEELARVDAAAEAAQMSRSAFLVSQALGGEPPKPRPKPKNAAKKLPPVFKAGTGEIVDVKDIPQQVRSGPEPSSLHRGHPKSTAGVLRCLKCGVVIR